MLTPEQAMLLMEVQKGLRADDTSPRPLDHVGDLFVLEKAGFIVPSVGVYSWATTGDGDAKIQEICGGADVVYLMVHRQSEDARGWRFVSSKGGTITTSTSFDSATPFSEGGEDVRRLRKKVLTHSEVDAALIVKISR